MKVPLKVEYITYKPPLCMHKVQILRGLRSELCYYSRDLGSGSNFPKQDLTDAAENPRRSNFNNYSEYVYCAASLHCSLVDHKLEWRGFSDRGV